MTVETEASKVATAVTTVRVRKGEEGAGVALIIGLYALSVVVFTWIG